MNSNRIWHLLARKLTGDATLEELQELEQYLLVSPELAASIELHSTYFEHQDLLAVTEDGNMAWEKLMNRLKKDYPNDFVEDTLISDENIVVSKKKHMIPYVLAGLCSLVLLVAIFWTNFKTEKINHEKVTISNNNTITAEFQKRVVLPDGSVILLNKNSNIAYNKGYGADNREITLTGEAYFDVAYRKDLPMIVHVGIIDIKVKGTVFNVMAFEEDNKVETSLIRGSVELYVNGDSPRKILMEPNEKVIIETNKTKNEEYQDKQISLQVDKLSTESNSGLIPEIAWVENKLVFNNLPFGDVKSKLERWYNVKIDLRNEALAAEKFTGVVTKESIETFLKALQMTYNFNYSIDKKNITIY